MPKLSQVIQEIEEKKVLVARYTTLLETDKKAFAAYKTEMEEALQRQLRAETERGKQLRQIISFSIWLITLIFGAALGAYFISLVEIIRSWLG